MTRPAFLVEGHMEQRILRNICPGAPARRIGCNGDNVSLRVMSKFIASQIRLLGNRHHPIIIIFDREDRQESSEELAADLLGLLHEVGLDDQDIRIFVADRDVEDWILKDMETLKARTGVDPGEGVFLRKGGLIRLLSQRVAYHETTVGVDLFLASNKERIAQSCQIFNALRNTALELGCDTFV